MKKPKPTPKTGRRAAGLAARKKTTVTPSGSYSWAEALVVPQTPPKRLLHIRIDEDVVAFFQQPGPGYLTRMNLVLREFVKKHSGKQSKEAA
jgi:uncharacterized protein (DUF4415 family)